MTDQVSQENEETTATAATPAQENQQHLVIKAKFNNLVDVKDVKFGFKSVDVEGPDGKPVIDEKTKKVLQTRRPTVEVPIPTPSVEGIVAILEGGDPDEIRLLLESVENVVIARARTYINDTEDVSAENFPFDILSWHAIAKMPPKERKGNGISKELWEEFAADYIQVLTSNGVELKHAETQSKLLLVKFQTVKSAKNILRFMIQQLSMYAGLAPNLSRFEDCVAFLMDKAETFLEEGEKSMLGNLGMKMD